MRSELKKEGRRGVPRFRTDNWANACGLQIDVAQDDVGRRPHGAGRRWIIQGSGRGESGNLGRNMRPFERSPVLHPGCATIRTRIVLWRNQWIRKACCLYALRCCRSIRSRGFGERRLWRSGNASNGRDGISSPTDGGLAERLRDVPLGPASEAAGQAHPDRTGALEAVVDEGVVIGLGSDSRPGLYGHARGSMETSRENVPGRGTLRVAACRTPGAVIGAVVLQIGENGYALRRRINSANDRSSSAVLKKRGRRHADAVSRSGEDGADNSGW